MPMSEEERREKNAAKQRAYRARKAAEREAAREKAKGDGGNGPAPTKMREAVTEAIASMKWLVASDIASKMQALDLARIIDEATHEGDDARALSAHRALSRVLNDLGGTPAVRLARELRSLKHAPKTEGDDERNEGEGGATPANVTKLERPKPRSRA